MLYSNFLPMRTQLFFLSLLIIFYLILFGVNSLSVSSRCKIDHQSNLIKLKKELQLNSSPSNKLVSWNPNATDCCTWVGIKCSIKGQVIGLDLSNENISGGIDTASALFHIETLQELNLAENNFFFTPIPSGLGSLTSLKILNLSNSGFSGQIPGELSQLTKLEVLDLSWLKPFGTSSLKLEKPNLAMLVGNLTRLKVLYLDNVNMSAHPSDWCQVISASLPDLEVLSLSNCHLSGPLDDSLEKLKLLSVIRLARNNLNTSVPIFFGNFRNLKVLQLGCCNLRGSFPAKVFQLQNLQVLDLSYNRNLHGSLSAFPVNRSLRSLVLSETNLSGAIPESIINLKSLSWIDLSRSNFSGVIPNSMENLTQLLYLDLSSNSFTGQIPSFQLFKNLTNINLSRNSLSGIIPSFHFHNLQNLVSVDLRFNAFSGSIPSSLLSLHQLQKIQLSNNNFDGVLADIPNPTASQLDTLDLSSNKLEGQIPKSFFKLGWLHILLLSSNNLNGLIETKDFQGLTNLMTLDLSFNNLSIETGSNYSRLYQLPNLNSLKLASCNLQKFPNLRDQSILQTLDLSDNKIVGEIPSWIWEVGNAYGGIVYLNLSHNQLTGLQEPYQVQDYLSVLDLHSNRLSGVIPVPPGTFAIFIDCSDNIFNSSLPKNIGENLFSANFFSVSNNLLTGEIPETLCNASYLKVLDLSNNQFTGSIPQCLIEYGGSLGVLNLGNNSLSGRVEGVFPSSCGLNTLDVNGNFLEGLIPQSLVNCTTLEVLNLGNNRITDTYPCSLRDNTSLRVLVLRSNKLHGSLRCGERQHNHWSKIQILDIAHNNFNGTVPAEYFWQWDAMITHDDGELGNKKHLTFMVMQLNNLYYQGTVTVTIKRLELKLVKILRIFTSIDISSNQFSGEIPNSIGSLKALYILNISNNEFTGSIPPSIGNLSELESLDMSSNKLTGEIPSELTDLPFLSVFDLSYNQLEGKIPTGSQFQTFTETSYEGNKGLCGFPLNINCITSGLASSAPNSKESNDGFDWQSLFYGMPVGFVITILYSFRKKGTSDTSRHSNLSTSSAGNGLHYT